MLKFVKRTETNKKISVRTRLIAVVLALLASAIFILILGLNPIEVYGSMIKGAFGSKYKITQTIIKAIPLVLTSLGVAIAFKMQFWNIGGEGQIIMGAFLASFCALKLSFLPKPVMLAAMMLAGVIGGGLWALIPALFKARWKTNETIITLMMNYIALKWITYLQYGPWKDPKALGFPKIPEFKGNAILPSVFGVHIGWIIALLLTILIYIFMNKTKRGYEIAVLGESERTALYAGMNIKRTIITAIFVSGGLCGLAGMIQASAVSKTLCVEITGGVGYTAIIVSWLSSLSAPIILLVSVLFAALVQGGSYIQIVHGIPNAAALILQSLILFFVLGSEFFVRYRLVFNKEGKRNNIDAPKGKGTAAEGGMV